MALYLAVLCRDNPDHTLYLRIIESADDWKNVAHSPFDETCEICGKRQQYYAHDVKVLKGPAPTGKFQTHPSFL